MKGIIFTYLEEYVVNHHGVEAWDTMLDYPSSDLMALVGTASNMTNQAIPDIVFSFGEFIAQKYYEDYRAFFKEGQTAKTFLKSVDQIIHVEVKKLYPEVTLPKIEYEDPAADKLVMIYSSKRRLCQLAKGLITGVGKIYNENISINEPECACKGSEKCRLELQFGSK